MYPVQCIVVGRCNEGSWNVVRCNEACKKCKEDTNLGQVGRTREKWERCTSSSRVQVGQKFLKMHNGEKLSSNGKVGRHAPGLLFSINEGAVHNQLVRKQIAPTSTKEKLQF